MSALVIRMSVEVFSSGTWHACEHAASMMGEEVIQRCAEVSAVLEAHGRALSRFMAPLTPAYERFRLLARETVSGVLVAYWMAAKSTETTAYLPWGDGKAVTMCSWCPIAIRCPDRLSELATAA
jgi:hypothetical protein